MKKYTIEELKTNKIAVLCKTIEEGHKISKALNETYFKKYWKDVDFRNSNNFSILLMTGLEWVNENTHPKYYTNRGLATKYINFEQIDFQEEIPSIITDYYCSGNKLAEQFKKLINKEMEAPKTFSITGKERHLKAILGDLKEMGYIDCHIYPYKSGNKTISTNKTKKSNDNLNYFKTIGDYITCSSSYHINFNLPEDYNKVLEHAKEAINSPFWNSQKEEIVSVGGKFDVKIKDGKVYHNTDDITELVKEMIKFYDSIPTKFDKYECTLKNATFFKTGCQNTETTLDDWKVVFNKLK